MSANPFAADRRQAERFQMLEAECGDAVRAEIALCAPLSSERIAEGMGGVLAAADVARIVSGFGLRGVDELMVLGLSVAERVASPPISDFFVGAVGLEAETGNLVFGGNVEFPGTHLGTALHGEGFVAARAFNRGTAIERIALGEAHPCGHCRQFLSEFAVGPDLELIDPLGHRLRLADLYPWPFDTRYLGRPGAQPGARNWPDLHVEKSGLTAPAPSALIAAGQRAHAPYSQCPGAILLELADGHTVTGSSIESVAFNPTLGPLQGAIVELRAHGYGYADILKAKLGTVRGGAVDYSASTAELLGALAPQARLEVVGWTV